MKITCPICTSSFFNVLILRADKNRIVRCSKCGHLYLNPPLSDDFLNNIYKDYYKGEGDDIIRIINQWFEDPRGPYQYALHFVEKVNTLYKKKILEVGCGPGRFLYECYKKGALVTGMDLSPPAVSLAKKYFGLDINTKKH